MAKLLKKAIQYAFAADRVAETVRETTGIPKNYTTILAVGPRSVGKTATAEAVAKEIAVALGKKFVASPNPGPGEFGFTVADLSGDTAESLGGLYEVVEGETRVFAHDWFPKSGMGLLVVDEFNRITPTAAPALQQLADKHKFGPHMVPKGWTVVLLGNPPQDGDEDSYMVNDGFDKSFFSRLCILPVKVTKADWIQFALENDIHEDLVNYVAVSDTVLTGDKALEVEKLFPIEPSPRSLETVSNLLAGSTYAEHTFDLPDLREDDDMFLHLATGCVGSVDALGIQASRKFKDRPMDALEVLNDYTTPDADGRTPQDKIRDWSDIANNQKSILAHITMVRVLKHIGELNLDDKDPETGKLTEAAKQRKEYFEKRQLPNLDLFLGDLREEEVITFTTKMRTEVGARGIAVLKIIQKHNAHVLRGLNDALEGGEAAA